MLVYQRVPNHFINKPVGPYYGINSVNKLQKGYWHIISIIIFSNNNNIYCDHSDDSLKPAYEVPSNVYQCIIYWQIIPGLPILRPIPASAAGLPEE